MAKIPVNNKNEVYTIKKWLGVNESGETNLRKGEASTMTNFKITDDFSLRKRPGTLNVAGLLSDYTVEVSDTLETVKSDLNTATSTFSAYPNVSITTGGILTLTGTAVSVNSANIESYTTHYYQQSGLTYKIGELEYVESSTGTTHVEGGSVNLGASTYFEYDPLHPPTAYSSIKVVGGQIVAGTLGSLVVGAYCFYANKWQKVFSIQVRTDGNRAFTNIVTYAGDDVYNWKFYPVTAVDNTSDSEVRGLWSGRIGTTEYIVAACNGHLWSLSETDDVWTKTDIGNLDTTKPVHFFEFNEKLYIMNGTEYYSWNGTTFAAVTGYRPLVSVAAPPTSGGTALQRINMLNGLRRVWFSPDGTAATFTLPEQNLASVDYAKVVATGASLTISSSDLTAGTTTLSAAPAAGTSTIEIGYTVTTTLRSQVVAMTLSEPYNGTSDNRVFIYGDGSNKAFYSDLDYNGQATAEYFPDLNVVHFGGSNTPLTSMVRHYDRLLAFKTDSTHSVVYDSITLPGGTVTAGFYVTTVNKELGCAGYGQGLIVGNFARTLDGRSIYNWVSTGTFSEQRSAERISQKVERTLREITTENAITFHDKVNHEYFIVDNGVAIVQNTENGVWYIYRNFPATCMIVYKDELYFGTATGDIRHVSNNYKHDIGGAITCYWESGSTDFGAEFRNKYSDLIWIVLKPEDDSQVYVTVQTDKQNQYDDESVIADHTEEVSTGFFEFLNLNFNHFTFNVNDKPQTQRRRIIVKNFAWYKLIFSTVSNDSTVTILSASIKVRQTGYVR